jgi:hypothetical protein
LTQLAKNLHKGLLNGVLRVLPIVGDVLSDTKEPAVVSPDKFFERDSVSSLAGMDESRVVKGRS